MLLLMERISALQALSWSSTPAVSAAAIVALTVWLLASSLSVLATSPLLRRPCC